MKTVEEWLNLIPNYTIRTRALRNMYKASKNNKRDTLYAAIGTAFNFNESPEGRTYWIKVRDRHIGNASNIGCVDNLEIF